ncbi:hypothetical protein [Adhaeribacter aquaticus]|uniref:hypothetical protein n=1 Tax=Adhaeribacter aquaticus TaxID=299567 RepID=UPI00047D33F4|nr:hypothetical protein [Adhaeribacter aquaticus]
MRLLQKLFSRRKELDFTQKKETFLVSLLAIEEKYFLYFKEKSQELSLQTPDRIQNYYSLCHEFEYVRFDYKSNANLPTNIRQECDAAYQKVWGNN